MGQIVSRAEGLGTGRIIPNAFDSLSSEGGSFNRKEHKGGVAHAFALVIPLLYVAENEKGKREGKTRRGKGKGKGGGKG
jgi:hypothetical protein